MFSFCFSSTGVSGRVTANFRVGCVNVWSLDDWPDFPLFTRRTWSCIMGCVFWSHTTMPNASYTMTKGNLMNINCGHTRFWTRSPLLYHFHAKLRRWIHVLGSQIVRYGIKGLPKTIEETSPPPLVLDFCDKRFAQGTRNVPKSHVRISDEDFGTQKTSLESAL